ncbi:hypothetical protein HDU91_006999, partial [Kappamyces sp. JEL0680]
PVPASTLKKEPSLSYLDPTVPIGKLTVRSAERSDFGSVAVLDMVDLQSPVSRRAVASPASAEKKIAPKSVSGVVDNPLIRDGDVKRIASMLFEWVRDSQKNVDRQKAKQRPPWLGTTERTRSNASAGFPPLETPAAVAGKRKEKGKKDLRLGTPPRLRSITGIVTFPESLSPKKERKEIQAPRKLSSAQYPSIDEEILRYEMEQASSFAPAAEIKAEPSKSLPRPRHSEHPSEADPESTVLARQEKSFVMGIEEREKTPKHMVSAPAPSRKGHPKTIDPFAVSHRKLKKSPYIL